jgi:hypothetical protein
VSGQFHVLTTVLPRKHPLYALDKDAGWAPEPVGTMWRRKQFLTQPGFKLLPLHHPSGLSRPLHHKPCFLFSFLKGTVLLCLISGLKGLKIWQADKYFSCQRRRLYSYVILYCSILLHSSLHCDQSTALGQTCISFFLCLKVLKVTTRFGQYGHHQVLNM